MGLMFAWSDTATGIVVIGCVVTVAILLNRKLSVRFRSVEATLGAIDKQTNGRPPFGPTLSEDVSVVRREIVVLRAAMVDLHGQNVARLEQLESVVRQLAERPREE